MMQNAFIRNRAEEFDHDVWSNYVLPLYFPQLGLHEARKSQVLQGGRGCGKTALLRYQVQLDGAIKEIVDRLYVDRWGRSYTLWPQPVCWQRTA
jgi:hypothetical protein